MMMEAKEFQRARDLMVERDLIPRGIRDPRVLKAFRQVPRHLFVEDNFRFKAYEDHPLPIGHGQTISQPYVVAAMTQALQLPPQAKVLDVGSGSGYQAAILAHICQLVYCVERVPALVSRSKQCFDQLQLMNVSVRFGDGFLGWPEFAPYDGIIVAAFGQAPPPILLDQLKIGARLVMPIGDINYQMLTVFKKEAADQISSFKLGRCAFVPLIEAGTT